MSRPRGVNTASQDCFPPCVNAPGLSTRQASCACTRGNVSMYHSFQTTKQNGVPASGRGGAEDRSFESGGRRKCMRARGSMGGEVGSSASTRRQHTTAGRPRRHVSAALTRPGACFERRLHNATAAPPPQAPRCCESSAASAASAEHGELERERLRQATASRVTATAAPAAAAAWPGGATTAAAAASRRAATGRTTPSPGAGRLP